MICGQLAPDEHAIFQALARCLNTRSGVYRISPENLAREVGLPYTQVRLALDGLVEVDAVRRDDLGAILLAAPSCGCLARAGERAGERAGARKSKALDLVRSGSDSPLRGESSPRAYRDKTPKTDISDQEDWGNQPIRIHDNPKPPQPLNAGLLAARFRDQATVRFFGKAPGSANVSALTRQFTTWCREDGISLAEIEAMMDVFFADPRLGTGSPPWKSFLAQRQRLHPEALRRLENRRARQGDRSGWEARRKVARPAALDRSAYIRKIG